MKVSENDLITALFLNKNNNMDDFKNNLLKNLSEKSQAVNRNTIKKIYLNDINGFSQVEVLKVGTGSPLIFLHGLGAIPETYELLLKNLAKEFTVYAPALPGHGFTFIDGLNNINMNTYLDFVDSIVSYFKLKESITFVGHNIGATISVAYENKNARKVSKLVLVEPLPKALNLLKLDTWLNLINASVEFCFNSINSLRSVLYGFTRHIGAFRYIFKTFAPISTQNFISKITSPIVIYLGLDDKLINSSDFSTNNLRDINILKVKGGHNWIIKSPELLKF